MTLRFTYNPLIVLAACALCGMIGLVPSAAAQQTPAAPPANAAAPTAAPIERQAPPDAGMQPGMGRGMGQGMGRGMGQGMRPGMMRPGMGQGMRAGMMHGRGNDMVGNARGGGMMAHRGGFHGSQGGTEAGFNIAPAGIWWRSPMVVQRIGLTADQTKKMDGIFDQSRLQLIDLKANVEKQNAILEPLLSANPPDTTKAMAQIDKVAEARAELEKANARMLLGIRGVLTPDQWTKLHQGPGGPGAASGAAGPGGAGRGPGGRAGRGPGGPSAITPAPPQ